MFLLEGIKKYAATDRLALVNGEKSMSYAELDAESEAFAAWLLETFPGDKTPVVIYGHKEMALLPCAYGALKAGRAYVPIDITVPADRVKQIVEEVRPTAAVDFCGAGIDAERTLSADGLADVFKRYRGVEVPRSAWASGSDYAYILFTSGSTGKPKGVTIMISNVENFDREFSPWLESGGHVMLSQASYSFDLSVLPVWLGTAHGFTLHTFEKSVGEDFAELFSRLGKSDISVWVSTPSFAEMCCSSDRFDEKLLPSLDRFIFCGEVLTHRLVDELFRRFPRAKVINTYGPTESTVLVSAVEVTAEMAADERSIPVGEPLPEVTFRIADEDGRELPEGEEGELLIISKSVSAGYFKHPDLTEKSFFTDEKLGKRGYHTGDSAYRLGNMYYYRGRIDNQIKLNGYRIEIEDVEKNLALVSNVARAAVLPVYDGETIRSLTAFVILEEPDGLANLERAVKIKRELRELIPAYMVPRRITAVDSFPLTANDKIDKKKLRELL